ncbi:MAG: hypothetical protein IPM07_26925 [Anaerolineales bacterium]|nr:hypothetical protein [Anaerolineales bacterium]
MMTPTLLLVQARQANPAAGDKAWPQPMLGAAHRCSREHAGRHDIRCCGQSCTLVDEV